MVEQRWYNLKIITDSVALAESVKTELQNIVIDARKIRDGVYSTKLINWTLVVYIRNYEITYVVLRDNFREVHFTLTVTQKTWIDFKDAICHLSLRITNNAIATLRVIEVCNQYFMAHPTWKEIQYLKTLCPLDIASSLKTDEDKASYVLKNILSLAELRKQ